VSLNTLELYPYAAAKAGLIHLTRQMAIRLISDHIVVSAIAPGAFASEMYAEARDHTELVAAKIPARRVGRPGDIAGAAVYLASAAGDYVVGATLVVDGGVTHAR
jgi:NAD(P)-dependent dehydrogenase (short-subunit alcohol dehydrogenase family)